MRTLAAATAAPGRKAGIAAAAKAASRSVSRREIIMMLPPESAREPTRRSDRSVLVRERAFPAPDLEDRVFLRPFRDLGRRHDHALKQRATALEIEMFVS